MFEITELSLVIQAPSGYKECAVYKFEDRLFFKNGAYFLRIKSNGRTSKNNISWVKFKDNYQPTFDAIGWAEANFL